MSVGEQLGQRPDEVKLQDLTVEVPEPKTKIEFDVEKEISEEDWEAMKGEYEKQCQDEDWWEAANQAMALKILFPERVEELDLDNKWPMMKRCHDGGRVNPAAASAVERNMCLSLKILFPERVTELKLADRWPRIKRAYEINNTYSQAIEFATSLKILFPGREAELELENIWLKMKDAYEREWHGSYTIGKVKAASFLRILFPKRVSELELENKWPLMREEYKRFCDADNWFNAIRRAAYMKILAAKEVKVTDQGLELVMPGEQEGFRQKAEPRPTRKELN